MEECHHRVPHLAHLAWGKDAWRSGPCHNCSRNGPIIVSAILSLCYCILTITSATRCHMGWVIIGVALLLGLRRCTNTRDN